MDDLELQRRIHEILEQKIAMGAGVLVNDNLMENMYGSSLWEGGYGTSEGARKAWATRRKNMRKAAKIPVARRKSGSKTAKKKPVKRASSSNWIGFVKKFAKENDLSYKDALSEAGPYWQQMKGTQSRVTKKKAPKRKSVSKSGSKTGSKSLADMEYGWQSCLRAKNLRPEQAKKYYCAKNKQCYKTELDKKKNCRVPRFA